MDVSIQEISSGNAFVAGSRRFVNITPPSMIDLRKEFDWRHMLIDVGKNTAITCVRPTNLRSVSTQEPATPTDLQAIRLAIESGRVAWDTRMFTVMLGSDPEYWLSDPNTGQLIPAFKTLPDKKAVTGPYQSFYDGFQAEFATDPHTCLQELSMNIIRAWRHIPATTKISLESVRDIGDCGKVPKKYLALGCMPSQNIYGHRGNIGVDGEFLPFRFAGCHMHFGLDPKLVTPDTVRRMVMALDRIAGVGLCALFGHLEDPRRRQFYGLAGEYRLPTHGLEWRVPSPQVLCHPGIFHLGFGLARAAVTTALTGLDQLWDCETEEAIAVINTSDYQAARKIMLRPHNQALLTGLAIRYYSKHLVKPTLDIFTNGLDRWVPNPTDVYGNWDLVAEHSVTASQYTWAGLASSRTKA